MVAAWSVDQLGRSLVDLLDHQTEREGCDSPGKRQLAVIR